MTDPKRGLSKPFAEAPAEHDILIVGSGYGGGVAATRLAAIGQNVTVLERGREFLPGEFPKDMVDGVGEMQTTLSHSGETHGKPYGLYDFRISDTVNAFIGCGLGGTSLINANVAIEADPRSMKDWPKPYSDPEALSTYYDRARKMLRSTPYPSGRTATSCARGCSRSKGPQGLNRASASLSS
ncbi:MAG: NAD-binding protein, partial [Pseudomonadota bacterium]